MKSCIVETYILTKTDIYGIIGQNKKGVIVVSLLDEFTPFNFNEGVAYVSITKNGVTFNRSVIMKLGQPHHVILLINEEKRQFAIKCCDKSTPNSVVFFKPEKRSNTFSVRWNSKDLLNRFQEMIGTSLEKSSYRINGTLLKDENAMLFDLSTAVELK